MLHDIDFDINKGDYLCIVGENGTGKSTLMKTLLGLQSPLAGKIIRGYDMKTGGIGYLPQQTGIQRDFPASVREVVMSGCQGRCGIRPFYSRAEKQLVQSAMVKMEITHLSGKCYRELSGEPAAAYAAGACPFALREICFFSMSLFRDWTPGLQMICTVSWNISTEKTV